MQKLTRPDTRDEPPLKEHRETTVGWSAESGQNPDRLGGRRLRPPDSRPENQYPDQDQNHEGKRIL